MICRHCGKDELHAESCPYAEGENSRPVTEDQCDPPAPPAPPAPAEKPKRVRVRDFAAEHAKRKARKAAAPPVPAAAGALDPSALAALAAGAGAPGPDAPAGATPPPPDAKRRGRRPRAEVDAELAATTAERDRLKAAQATPRMTAEQCAGMLDGTLKAFSGAAIKLTGTADAGLLDAERATLVQLWSPFLPELLAQHGDKAPLTLALIGTIGVLARPVLAVVAHRQARQAHGPVTVESIVQPVSR